MPAYLTPQGISCTADQALAGGKLRPGYHEILADGESVGFAHAFSDSKSRGSVFLTDTSVSGEVDRAHAAHDAKFDFMGDRAPKFDRETAEFLARKGHSQEQTRAIRDAAHAAQTDPSAVLTLARLSDHAEGDYKAQQARLSDQRRNAWKDGAAVRDAARRSQYGR
jgi:hypothetical protein